MSGIPKPLADRLPDVQAFRDSLDPETDRGCAITAASYVDDQLAEMLKVHLVDSKKLIKEVFAGSGALSTFSARIDLSFLLGHIAKAVQRELHLIRGIRNKFAHSSRPLSFTEPAIDQQCRALVYSHHPKSREARAHFCSSATAVLAFIHVSHHRAKRPSAKPDFTPTEAGKEKTRTQAIEQFMANRSKNI